MVEQTELNYCGNCEDETLHEKQPYNDNWTCTECGK